MRGYDNIGDAFRAFLQQDAFQRVDEKMTIVVTGDDNGECWNIIHSLLSLFCSVYHEKFVSNNGKTGDAAN